MDGFTILLQIGLAVVLAVAGVGKLLDLAGSQHALRDFGVPDRYAVLGGPTLPVAELLLALGLLVPATARWAALLVGLLFLAFIAGIGWNLRQGRQPACHCFGQIHSEPAGWQTLARNTVLVLATGLVVWRGGLNPVGWLADLSTAGRFGAALGIVILAVTATLAWLLHQLRRQNERILARLEALEVEPAADAIAETPPAAPAELVEARTAPAFDLPDQDGRRLTLRSLLSDRLPTLLIFSDPGCGPCNSLLPDVGEWQRRYANTLRVALISRRSLAENLAKSAEHGIALVGLQEGREIDDLYEVNGTPTGILVQPDGTIRHQQALGPGPIRSLVARLLTNAERAQLGQPALPAEEPTWDAEDPFASLPTPIEVGAPAPTLPLRDLAGHFTGLDDYRGREPAVLFVSPSCAFSQRILPDLREWAEEEAGPVLERLIIVTDGAPEEIAAMALPGRVLVDEGFTLGRACGARGTPAALLLDAQGKVAAPLANGTDNVLDLLYEQSEANDGVPAAP
jgi:thiol-disulfide isomerase/thioredoxin/uncharacterized membrane protein YphA (DoxX/SURF4 family)